jgi:hypothetical protein
MKDEVLILMAGIMLFSCSVSSAGVMIYADADGYSDGADISNAFIGMTLSSVGTASGLDGKVYAKTDSHASTGTMTFSNNLANPTVWYRWQPGPGLSYRYDYAFRVDFDMSAKYVALDVIGEGERSLGIIYAFDSSGKDLFGMAIFSTNGFFLMDREIVHVEIDRSSYDIDHLIIGGAFNPSERLVRPIHLDNLSAEILPEPATLSLLGLGILALRRRR